MKNIGGATIWEHKRNDEYKIDLYFGVNPKNQDDIKWAIAVFQFWMGIVHFFVIFSIAK